MLTLTRLLFILGLTLSPSLYSTNGVTTPCLWSCLKPCQQAPQCGLCYNPSAYCLSPCASQRMMEGVSLRCDLLWWRATEGDTTLGKEETFFSRTTKAQSPVFRETLINRTRVKNLHSHFKPGFRLGLDYLCLCQGWDAALNWTHYHSRATAVGRSRFDEGKMKVFIPCWERLLCLVPEEIKGTWKLGMDLVDLELGKDFHISSCFAIRPQFGIRVARIRQTYAICSYANDEGRGAGLSDIFIDHVRASETLWAAGPRLGASIEFRMGCGLALFGGAATSLLYGCFDRHARESCALLPDGGGERTDYEYYSAASSDKSSRAVSDLAIGLSYTRCYEWCGRLRRCSLSLAWEHHAFYGLNAFNFASHAVRLTDMKSHLSCGKRGNLYTQGLVISAEVGF